MKELEKLFSNNKAWAEESIVENPKFFERLAEQQSPEYLWIGCSDSRVPANVIVDLLPGELFVHRNVANLVVHTDLNCLSVVQYAIDVLRVRHIIVCGHYQCGGVLAALENKRGGLVDNWLGHVRDVVKKHQAFLDAVSNAESRADRLCELNVIEQVANLCETTIVQEAWRRQQPLTVHGWIYDIRDGRLQDLDICVAGEEELPTAYATASAKATKKRTD